jgi:hypothetical protein
MKCIGTSRIKTESLQDSPVEVKRDIGEFPHLMERVVEARGREWAYGLMV